MAVRARYTEIVHKKKNSSIISTIADPLDTETECKQVQVIHIFI